MSYYPKGKIRLYGCSGCGINLASRFYNLNTEMEINCGEPHPCFIDTSYSNMREEFNEKDFMVIEGVKDGSGKVRLENYEVIKASTKQIVHKFPPMDLNIILFSASGGSGSVIGPLLAAELLERDCPVLVVAIGTYECVKAAKNTIDVLKGLDGVSRKVGKPIVMYYEQNDLSRTRIKADENIVSILSALMVLGSRQNEELDSSDIAHWVNFSKVTEVGPQLAQLEIFHNLEQYNKEVKDPISVISLLDDRDKLLSEVVPEYQATGYFKHRNDVYDQLHYVISTEKIPKIYKGIYEVMESYNERRESRVRTAPILSDKDDVTDTGLVF